MNVAIRPATNADISRIEAIENAADVPLIELLGATRWEPAASGESRSAGPGFLLVASDTSETVAVGFVHVLELAGGAHLEQLSVLPAHARHGIGRALVEAALGEASRRGFHELTLRTYAEVPWNAPFYGTCGFVLTEASSDFHRRLVQIEGRLGLDLYGRRVQMTARLDP